MKKIFNFKYCNFLKEIILGILLEFSQFSRRNKTGTKNGKILIVIPCRIGEFAAAIPAIFCFIQKNKNKRVDLLVAPLLKSLAERISGVGRVYIVSSTSDRECKKDDYQGQSLKSELYEELIVMRINSEAYKIIKNIKKENMRTALYHGLKYLFHLMKNLILGRTPKKWETFNFEVLVGDRFDYPKFSEIFEFKEKDYKTLITFEKMKDAKLAVIIHTWADWPMKRWDNQRWVRLLQKINKLDNFIFIFIGNASDLENYQYIAQRLNFKTASLINKINLSELILILSRADYFIGIDSGPRNLAHLADLRSVTILGPGPHMFMPNNQLDIVIDKTDGRGVLQLFFFFKKSYTKKISVGEVYDAFKKIYTASKTARNIVKP